MSPGSVWIKFFIFGGIIQIVVWFWESLNNHSKKRLFKINGPKISISANIDIFPDGGGGALYAPAYEKVAT